LSLYYGQHSSYSFRYDRPCRRFASVPAHATISSERGALSEPVLARLAACVEGYRKHAALPANRRRRVGLVVRGANVADRLAIATYVADRLKTTIAFLDAAHLEGAHADDAADYIRPLVENVRRVALVEGLTSDLDARLHSALLWSSRDVLVVACVEGSEFFDPRLAKRFPFVVDCRAKVRSLPFVTALRV
jgi:hypothetical protein